MERDWKSSPGDTIADALEELGMTPADMVRAGLDRALVDGLLAGTARISPEIADFLERLLGGPAAFWLRRDALFRGDTPRNA